MAASKDIVETKERKETSQRSTDDSNKSTDGVASSSSDEMLAEPVESTTSRPRTDIGHSQTSPAGAQHVPTPVSSPTLANAFPEVHNSRYTLSSVPTRELTLARQVDPSLAVPRRLDSLTDLSLSSLNFEQGETEDPIPSGRRASDVALTGDGIKNTMSHIHNPDIFPRNYDEFIDKANHPDSHMDMADQTPEPDPDHEDRPENQDEGEN